MQRIRELGERAQETFPMRVWTHFSRNNGFLLSAGMGYYVMFALFALLYVAFAAAGIWLGASPDAIATLIDIINTYIPGFIGEDGFVSSEDVTAIAKDSTGLFGVTAAIAFGVGIWTAIGAVTFTRRAVRNIFGLPYDDRPFILLKLRDLLAGLIFGGAILLGSILATAGVWALTAIFELLGWSTESWFFTAGVRVLSILVIVAINGAAIAGLVRFLTGTSIRWRAILPGAFLGGLGLTVLQLALGFLISRGSNNPLLQTFAVIIAVLLWCRLISAVVLAAASWIAVTTEDLDQPLSQSDPDAAQLAHLEARVLAALLQVSEAEGAASIAPWYRRRATTRRLSDAHHLLDEARTALESEKKAQFRKRRNRQSLDGAI